MSALKDLGGFIREQRSNAQISLRQLAAAAGVSNPYLSQIERGLRKPSAEILQQIAKGLRISAEALYVQAGMLDERVGDPDVVAAVVRDSRLSERQKHVLLEIYESFVRESAEAQRVAAQARMDEEVAAAAADSGHAAGPDVGDGRDFGDIGDLGDVDGFVRPAPTPGRAKSAGRARAERATGERERAERAKAAPRKKATAKKTTKRAAKKAAARPSGRAPVTAPTDLKTASEEERA